MTATENKPVNATQTPVSTAKVETRVNYCKGNVAFIYPETGEPLQFVCGWSVLVFASRNHIKPDIDLYKRVKSLAYTLFHEVKAAKVLSVKHSAAFNRKDLRWSLVRSERAELDGECPIDLIKTAIDKAIARHTKDINTMKAAAGIE